MSFLYKTCSPVVHIKCILYVDVFLPLSHVKWRPGPLHRLRVFPTDGVCVRACACVCPTKSGRSTLSLCAASRQLLLSDRTTPSNPTCSSSDFQDHFPSACSSRSSHDIMMYVTHQKGSSIWRDAFGKLAFSEAYTIHIDILTYYIWYIHNTYNTYIVMWCIYLPHYSYTKCSKTGPGPSRGSQNNSFIRFVFCC